MITNAPTLLLDLPRIEGVPIESLRGSVFRALYQHLEDLAKSSPDVIGLHLYVETHNARAQQAYQKLGFRDASYTVMEQIFRNDV